MSSKTRKLYVGVTSDLKRRIHEHRAGVIPGFTSKYRINQLVYFEQTPNITAAIQREKEIRAGPERRRFASLKRRTLVGWISLRMVDSDSIFCPLSSFQAIQARSLALLGMTKQSLQQPMPSGGFSRQTTDAQARCYSPFSTPAGSTRAARRAGIHAAASAVPPSRTTRPM